MGRFNFVLFLVGAAVLSACGYEDVTNEAGLTTRTWVLEIPKSNTEGECADDVGRRSVRCAEFTLTFTADCFDERNGQPTPCPLVAPLNDDAKCETTLALTTLALSSRTRERLCFERAFYRIGETLEAIEKLIDDADEAMENKEYRKAELLYLRAKVGIAKYTIFGGVYTETFAKASQGLSEARRQQNKSDGPRVVESAIPSDCDGPPGSLC